MWPTCLYRVRLRPGRVTGCGAAVPPARRHLTSTLFPQRNVTTCRIELQFVERLTAPEGLWPPASKVTYDGLYPATMSKLQTIGDRWALPQCSFIRPIRRFKLKPLGLTVGTKCSKVFKISWFCPGHVSLVSGSLTNLTRNFNTSLRQPFFFAAWDPFWINHVGVLGKKFCYKCLVLVSTIYRHWHHWINWSFYNVLISGCHRNIP